LDSNFSIPEVSKRTLIPTLGGVASVALLLFGRIPARGEDSFSYKYEDYSEADGRVGVHTQSALIEKGFGPDTQFNLTAVNDAIAGATPTGEPAPAGSSQVPITQLHDHRKAWDADLSHQFARIDITAGFAESREHDYISKGWSLNTLTDFNEKNTTLLFGAGGHSDDVEVFYLRGQPYIKKWSNSGILGVTQLLSPRTSVTFNLSWQRETGDLNDQYKIVTTSVVLFPGVSLPEDHPESRPHQRSMGDAYLSLEQAFPELHGSLEGSYRYYADTFGEDAHTLQLKWFQHLGGRLILIPDLRLYEQSAAHFYIYDLDGTGIVPYAVPESRGPYYSSDYRLSSLYTTTYGLKAVWTPVSWLELNVSWDRYTMHGRDGITPQSAYPRANNTVAGAKISW